jgi:hypothetical protein
MHLQNKLVTEQRYHYTGVYRGFEGNLRERDYLEDPDVDGRTILRWIFRGHVLD